MRRALSWLLSWALILAPALAPVPVSAQLSLTGAGKGVLTPPGPVTPYVQTSGILIFTDTNAAGGETHTVTMPSNFTSGNRIVVLGVIKPQAFNQFHQGITAGGAALTERAGDGYGSGNEHVFIYDGTASSSTNQIVITWSATASGGTNRMSLLAYEFLSTKLGVIDQAGQPAFASGATTMDISSQTPTQADTILFSAALLSGGAATGFATASPSTAGVDNWDEKLSDISDVNVRMNYGFRILTSTTAIGARHEVVGGTATMRGGQQLYRWTP